MLVNQLIAKLQELDASKDILCSFGGEWFEVELCFLPCPDWPEYFLRIEVGSPKRSE